MIIYLSGRQLLYSLYLISYITKNQAVQLFWKMENAWVIFCLNLPRLTTNHSEKIIQPPRKSTKIWSRGLIIGWYFRDLKWILSNCQLTISAWPAGRVTEYWSLLVCFLLWGPYFKKTLFCQEWRGSCFSIRDFKLWLFLLLICLISFIPDI